jgi:putative aldouronate transport system permease protein
MRADSGGILQNFRRNRALLLMLLPAVIYFFVFAYAPMAGVVIAFKRLDHSAGIFRSPWVGWDNFRFFFLSGQAYRVTRNTVLYNSAFIAVNMVLQIGVALFLSEITRKSFRRITQTVLLLPYFLSWVVVSAFLFNLFNYEYGVLNTLLKAMGAAPVDLLGTVGAWKFLIVGLDAWKEVGYGSIIYLAAIAAIEREMYESAQMDGAGILQRTVSITIPSLKTTAIILFLLGIGQLFRGNFPMFYQLVGNNGLLYDATDVIDTFVFRSLINTQEVGMASAAGLYQSVLCLLILLGTNYAIRRRNAEYALF